MHDVCEMETDAEAFIEKILNRQRDVKGIYNAAENIAKAQAK